MSRKIETKKKFVRKNSTRAPKPLCIMTAQGSVPIAGVHERYGILETYPGCFVKSYEIEDNNYLTSTEEEQLTKYQAWRKLLHLFGPNTDVALTINNKSVDYQTIKDEILLKEVGDKYDYLRRQMNDIITDRIRNGKNGIAKEKLLTVGVHPNRGAREAAQVYHQLERGLNDAISKAQSGVAPVPLEKMLDTLYSIYNDPNDHLVQKTRVADDEGRVHEVVSFDFAAMRSMGLSVRDVLSPSSIIFRPDHIVLGKKYARAFRVEELPSQISDEVLTNLTDLDFNCLTTLNFREIAPKQANAMVGRNLTLVRDAKTKQIKAGQRQGVYDDSFVDPKLLEREEEALKLKEAMHQNDEKLFRTLLTVVVFADTLEKLDEYSAVLDGVYKKASIKIDLMKNRQEEGFNATLPLCYNQIPESRTLTSSAVAGFIPFSTLELRDPGGINYSCNLISKNLIVYDRMSSSNFNGFILGTPGSGKSFSAKVSMLNTFLNSNADIIVIDPEDEYGAMAKLLGGEIIKITPGGDYHINPLEIVSGYELEDETNPVNAKADFVLKIIECINKSPFGINSVQETIVDECVHELFRPFERKGVLGVIPEGKMPTLTDLQILLSRRREPEAREISMALKLYSGGGSLNTFGSQTNVRTSSRFVVYQIRDIGDRLKNLAMLTILDHIWNQIVANRKIGKNTWFFVDEIYLLFQNEYSAAFLNTLFRRARKYGGVPTGLTQNVSPLLESPTARDMLQNCCFIQILNQAGPDRDRLKELLNLSDTQIGYITSSPKGQGLLYTGKNTVPFYSVFPKDNDIYKCLTSDLSEIKAYEMAEKREKSRKQKELAKL